MKDRDFATILKLNQRIQALEARLATAKRRKANPFPAATTIALVGLSARLKLRQIALREHVAKQERFLLFVDRLNALRLDRGLTFEQVGERAGIPAKRVHALLHGDINTQLRDLVTVCLALRVRAQIALVPTSGGHPAVIPLGHDVLGRKDDQ